MTFDGTLEVKHFICKNTLSVITEQEKAYAPAALDVGEDGRPLVPVYMEFWKDGNRGEVRHVCHNGIADALYRVYSDITQGSSAWRKLCETGYCAGVEMFINF